MRFDTHAKIAPDELTRVVAIDGPAGAGKSTVARAAAERLGFSFLDTGAMYRAATWWAMEEEADLDTPAVAAEAARTMDLELRDQDDALRVLVAGRDVTEAIRTPAVTRNIYKLDENAEVRKYLVMLQRQYAAANTPCVAEGRDMGTVVFPYAKCKVFLDASLEERARRRLEQLERQGVSSTLEEVRQEVHDRDERTRNREVAPLKRAEDAILVDTTELSIDEAAGRVVKLARERL